ncbi:MAG TPA: hypothetical protein VF710_16775 [Longimicrobium sp.]|jgi:phosphate/sulfate permease
MLIADFAKEADRYWSVANVLTGFYFAQALTFWYKLGDKDFAKQISKVRSVVLALLWAQAGAVSFLVYGCFILENRLLEKLGREAGEVLISTSEIASYARIVIVVLITTMGSAFVWFVDGRRE